MVCLSPAMVQYYGLSARAVERCIAGCIGAGEFVKRSRSLNPDTLVLGGVGALVRWKGWHRVVAAMGRLPETMRRRVRWVHIGAALDEEYRLELDRLGRDLGLADQIEWRGEWPDAKRLWSEVDALVIASDHEAFSIAMLEGMAAGVPVLAADSGGAADAIDAGKNGWLFSADDEQSLADLLQRVLQDRSQLVAANEGPMVAEKFEASVIARRWDARYGEVVEGAES